MRNLAGATVPVAVLVVVWGGVDPMLALVAGACLVSWAISLAALSIAVSVLAPTGVRAFSFAGALTVAWLALPAAMYLLLPKLWPAGARVVAPVLLWLIESSPMAVLAHLIGRSQAARSCGRRCWGRSGAFAIAWLY